ncbi:hypothetical protein KPL78_00665 [Roseomonas sp. HJA6]|uniref:SGNH/GDSL hydrolase family protein n=1 Tax=Roseomonas alba TaxID=2846776 RepID=A0ABS7A3J7_9PROT|nr:hypothetical protein [Neoroseomonas alba]MBW6396332.1 hypothetical protein [Neoroseomonas alba]
MAKTPRGRSDKSRTRAKSSAKKTKARKALTQRSAPKRVAVPETGPVTLAEAQAIVAARRPALALARAEILADPTPITPRGVAEERRRLRRARDTELEQRLREYTETMAVMRARGALLVPRTKQPPGGEGAAAIAAGEPPLNILAEGDSWFDYPPFFPKGGIVRRLQDLIGLPILNLAKAGDEVRFMLGVEERRVLTNYFANGSPAGGRWDAVLFSGGGNDIVDNPMALWVRDFDPAVPPAQLVHSTRFNTALDLVRAGYEDLIALRDRYSPDTHLLFHGYDFAIPDGRGVCFLGPWLRPTFALRGFPATPLTAAQAVVREMLERFARMLGGLATANPRVTFVNGQGTLPVQTSSWHNELHPSRPGFDSFAALFRQALLALFPGRVR